MLVAATELAAAPEEGSAAPLDQGGPIAREGGSSAAATGQSGAPAVEPEATRRESAFVRWRRCQSQQRGGKEVRTDKDKLKQVRTATLSFCGKFHTINVTLTSKWLKSTN